MGPLLFLLPVVGAAAGAAYVLYREARTSALGQTRALRSVAEAVGLTDTEVQWTGVFGPTTSLNGQSGVLRVWIWTRLRGATSQPDSEAFTPRLSNVIMVEGLGHGPDDLEFHPETFGTSVGKALGSREIELGDYGFDESVFLQGSEPLIYALFDYDTRRSVVALIRSIDSVVSLTNGALRVEIPDTLDAPAWLAERVTSVLEVARRLARPADIASLLAANLGSDPVVAVRLRNLEILVREYPRRPVTTPALRAALNDASAEVRFHAAMALGVEAHETLLAIASAEDGEQDAASAIEALGEHLPRERAETILGHSLRTRRVPVARACLEVLGERGEAECVEPLARVLAVERGELAEVAARSLGVAGCPEAEAPLVAALSRRDDAVKRAALGALGQCGSATAVAPLQHFESASRDSGCRWAARRAIAQIQSRLTGANPGQLSLAGGESGQLSLTEDEAGRVALLEDDDDATPGESGSGSQI